MNRNSAKPSRQRQRVATVIAMIVGTCGSMELHAMDMDTGSPDLKVRWDNTFKYSTAFRVKSLSSDVTAGNPNLDDGDYNFGRGLVSNRLDLLSEFDAVYKENVGVRVSAAAWYDSVYNRKNDNPGLAGGAVPSARAVPYNEFTDATRTLHGRKAELLDAFVFGKGEIADKAVSGRLGRHALLWGESLFFGENGIAGTQAPTDVVKLLSVPNSQFKEVIRPVNQLSGQIQLSQAVSIGAYVQFQWQPSVIPAAGSYLSRTDIMDKGGELLYLPDFLGGPVPRAHDILAKNAGQGGVQLRWRSDSLDTDFGFYATRFHDKAGQVELRPGRDYRLVYHEGTNAFGVSASRSFGSVNIGAEASVRRNASLVAAGGTVLDLTGTGDNHSNPLYPIGNTAHAQVSAIHTLEREAFWDGGLLMAEVAWHRRTSITRNAAALDPNTTRDALGLRVLMQPTWFQAFPGVDVSAPIGIGYNPKGRSSVLSLFNGGWDKGGDLSVGLSFDYQQTWKGGVNLTHYFGAGGGVLNAQNNYSFRQSLKDRDFISFTIQRSL
jgi:hypothetical protein